MIGLDDLGLSDQEKINYHLVGPRRKMVLEYINRFEDPQSLERLDTLRELNDYQIKGLIFNLPFDSMSDSVWKEATRAQLILDYIEGLSNPSEEYGVVKNFNWYQIKVCQLGLKPKSISNHNWQDNKLCTITLRYLRNHTDKNIDIAYRKIEGLNAAQVSAVMMGLDRNDLVAHKWHCPQIARATLEYLFTCSNGQSIKKRMKEIRGLSYWQILMCSMGYTRKSLVGIEPAKMEEIYEYINLDPHTKRNINSIKKMRATKDIMKKFFEYALKLGLSELDKEGHDWKSLSTVIATIAYLKNNRDDVVASMAQIRSMNAHQIELVEMGIPREMVLSHTKTDEQTMEELLEYLSCKDDVNDAFQDVCNKTYDEIIALNKDQALKLGLSHNDLEGHLWDSNTSSDTLGYLKSNIDDVVRAMNEIRGLTGEQIIALTLGLQVCNQYGHDWGDRLVAVNTIHFLMDQKKDTQLATFNEIRGMDKFMLERKLSQSEKSNKPLNKNIK